MTKVNIFGKKYMIDVDKLLFNFAMTILSIIVIFGFFRMSRWELEIEKYGMMEVERNVYIEREVE